MTSPLHPVLKSWFAARGWTPFPFQEKVWSAYRGGESGLIHAATGTGKTYAAWFAAVSNWLYEDGGAPPDGLRVLWLTPLRALATDTTQALQMPLADLDLPWSVEKRTGDVSSYRKKKQLESPPTALVTTPESLSLMLSQKESRRFFRNLELVVVDEWHELLGNKRGVQTELGLARLRRWKPDLRLWGLSATLGNLDVALAALLGVDEHANIGTGRLVKGLIPKEIIVDSLIPDSMERFPWAGHLGLKMLPDVLRTIEESDSTLIFTNTRNQTENWYRAILDARPDWAGTVALHHGSLAQETRQWVEDGLRAGSLRAVVCTSSLDLGVDFSPVDRVLQVGSPKGVARLLQRAGRSGHQPGVISRVTCVPTHAFELIEAAAAREATGEGIIEGREPVEKPLDLLAQHLVTIALGGGFVPEELLAEVRTTYSFRDLTDQEWQWALDFVTRGGDALTAYPEYHRVTRRNGTLVVPDRKTAQRHRLGIGTIVSDPSIKVKYIGGQTLGTINESFISRLSPGDKFIFAGRPLNFVRVREMTAWVQRARSVRGAIPRWTGTSLPISPELGEAVRRKLNDASQGVFEDPELRAVQPILRLQQSWSLIPEKDELLIERLKTREGYHLFVYSFAGKLVHQGLAALLAYRLATRQPLTFTLTANDYGFELLSPEAAPLEAALAGDDGHLPLLTTDNLLADIPASLNASEMARRQFREVARIAGLIHPGFPGQARRARHIQASSDMFFDVFRQYDLGNLLLRQADREVLERQLDHCRLAATLNRMATSQWRLTEPARPTPFCFPLLVSRLSARLSTESLADRVQRLTARLEKWADEP